MTNVEIHTAQVRQVGQDLSDIAGAIMKGINAAHVVKDLVTAHWTGDDRAQRVHLALRDWTDIAPSIQAETANAANYLENTVAPTYERLGQ